MVSLTVPYKMTLLRGVESGQITSDIGQKYLWNRIISIGFLFVMGVADLFLLLLVYLLAPEGRKATSNRITRPGFDGSER